MSKHIINTPHSTLKPTIKPTVKPTQKPTTHAALHWAFALIVGVLSVFTLTAENRSPASYVLTAPTQATQAPGADGTQISKTDKLLSSRATATLSRLLTGFGENTSGNPEGSDAEHGLIIALTGATITDSVSIQEACFYFLITSIHQAPYSPRSPPYLA